MSVSFSYTSPHSSSSSPSSLHSFQYGKTGPWVMLLHGAASHTGQWKNLISLLSPSYRIIAFDQYGYGKSPSWSLDRPLTLEDQIQSLIQWIQHQNEPIHLVAHSHGATLATLIATRLPHLIRSLSLYEPNTFTLLDPKDPQDARAIQITKEAFGCFDPTKHQEENHPQFAEDLMHFWLGEGAWAKLPPLLQHQLISLMTPTLNEVNAVISDPVDPTAWQTLSTPTLLMHDPHTPFPAQRVVQRYASLLPSCRLAACTGMGHLAPIHAHAYVNTLILDHLNEYER